MKKSALFYLILHGLIFLPGLLFLALEFLGLLFGGDNYELCVKLFAVTVILAFLAAQWFVCKMQIRAIKIFNLIFGIIGVMLSSGFIYSNTVGFLDVKGGDIVVINVVLSAVASYFVYISVYNILALKSSAEHKHVH